MNGPTMDSVVQRLERLEREHRRVNRVGSVVLVGVVAAVLMGQTKPSKVPKVVEAEQFVIRDAGGMQRASLGVLPGGAVGLLLTDKDGKRRAVLSVSADGYPGMVLADKDEMLRALLLVAADGIVLGLKDKDGKTRAGMDVSADDIGHLYLNLDKHGQPQTILTEKRDDAPLHRGTWVLWSQFLGPNSVGLNSELRAFALGAWATRSECEEQKIPYEKRRQEQKDAGSSGIWFVCLPDTVDPRGQR